MQWYRKKDVRAELFGVFEGGGAKGVAFAGALKAIAENNWWFHSVGGASAGAITAALVASGIHPDEIGSATVEILTRLNASKGWSKLISKGEYFQKSEVRDWLIEIIRTLTCLEDPSFLQLRDKTGIHLDVVATNISTQNLIVFSADDTPRCSVADAVASSAAIPFAFTDGVLVLPFDNENWSQAIVDGGVWANFPLFLYADEYFRRYYDRVPQNVNQNRLIGFVLDEHEPVTEGVSPSEPLPSKIQRNANVKFGERWWAFGRKEGKVTMWEHRDSKGTHPPLDKTYSVRLTRVIQGVISWPLVQLGEIGLEMGFGQAGWLEDARCPSSTKRGVVEVVYGGLSALGSPIWAVVAVLLLLGSTCYAMVLFWFWIIGIFNAASGVMSWFLGFAILMLGYGTVLVLIVLVFATASIGLIFFLQSPIRRVLWGVISTYVASSGSPEWYRCHPAVVHLPVGGVGTLDFDMTNDQRTAVESRAFDITLNWIKKRLPS